MTEPYRPTVVIQAHPLEASYNAALRDGVLGALRPSASAGSGSAGSEPGAVPCYRLGLGERPSREVLVEARRLVLVYPTWSGGLPAALLDWVHGVLDDPVPVAGEIGRAHV